MNITQTPFMSPMLSASKVNRGPAFGQIEQERLDAILKQQADKKKLQKNKKKIRQQKVVKAAVNDTPPKAGKIITAINTLKNLF